MITERRDLVFRISKAKEKASSYNKPRVTQEARDITPSDHFGRADRLHSLGSGYEDRYQKTKAMINLEIAIQRFQEALDHSSSPINNRLDSGRALFTWHAEVKNWFQAYQAAFKTVSLVPQLTPRSLDTSDKQHFLTDLVGLASDASAIALNATKTSFDAIQALELGRGLITESLTEIRIDISYLQQKHPQLAEEYVILRDQLDIPSVSTERHMNQRYKASQDLEKQIQQIRRLSDFDRFLLAPSEDELRVTAERGPIVIINVSDYRCDALIIEKIQIRSLRLSRLRINDIQDFLTQSTDSLAKPEILKWLWEVIAQPVLEMLELVQTPLNDCWSHMWWIPTGPLAKFPIHAAGYYSEGLSDNVLDPAISSYSSSVKTLIHGRRHRLQITRTPRSENIILIAIPKTPKKRDLQFATNEIDELTNLCSSMNLQVKKPLPYNKSVLSR